MPSPCLTLLLSTFIVLCTAARRRLVTSPSTCFTNLDCPSYTYCDNESHYHRAATRTCIPYVPVGGKCYRLQCASGLFCTADGEYPFDDEYECRPRLALGLSCTFNEECSGYPNASCQNPLLESRKGVCVNKPARATRGQSCGPPPYGSGCDVGLYCDGETTKCLPQKNGGQKCGLYDEQCLSGSCVQVTSRPRVNVCLSLQKVGEKCTADKQCAGFSSGDSLCNIPRGSTGTCVRIVKLLTALGEACSPINDHCDARRGLSCRWGGNGLKFVCAQRASDDDNGISNRYCTSGADRRLSSCKPSKGLPTECRKGDNLFPKCLPKTEIVQQGKICTAEGLRPVCAPGLTCSSSDAVFEERGSSKVTKYCAKLVDEGETCDRIGTQCSGPLECVDGTCTNVPYRPTSLAEDYAQLGAVYNGFQLFCGDTDCAPGLECNDSYCEVSVVPAKKGDNCFKTAGFAKKCETGTVCNVGFNGYGVRQCREPFGVDGTCYDDSHCKPGLECRSETFYGEVGKCYNPKLSTLKVGETCNPTAGPMGRRCVPDTQCLPKKTKGKFVCQKTATLGSACGDRKNVACVDGASCSSYNVCV